MKKTYVSLICYGLLWVLTGCGSQIENFVREAVPKRDPATEIGTTIDSSMSIKLTPGKMNAAAPDMVVQGTITATNQTYSMGPDHAVTLTLSRTRVTPQ